MMQQFKDSIDFVSLLDLADPFLHNQTAKLDDTDLDSNIHDLNSYQIEKIEAQNELKDYEKAWNASDSNTQDVETNNENINSNSEEKDEEKDETENTINEEKPLIEEPAHSLVRTRVPKS
jgi:peptidoglycan hydrolase CwlO-like protein